MGISRIPMPQNGMDAFLTGMTQSQAMFDSMMTNKMRPYQLRLLDAQAKEAEAKAAAMPMQMKMFQQMLGGDSGSGSQPTGSQTPGAFDQSGNATTYNSANGVPNASPSPGATPQQDQQNINNMKPGDSYVVGSNRAPQNAWAMNKNALVNRANQDQAASDQQNNAANPMPNAAPTNQPIAPQAPNAQNPIQPQQSSGQQGPAESKGDLQLGKEIEVKPGDPSKALMDKMATSGGSMNFNGMSVKPEVKRTTADGVETARYPSGRITITKKEPSYAEKAAITEDAKEKAALNAADKKETTNLETSAKSLLQGADLINSINDINKKGVTSGWYSAPGGEFASKFSKNKDIGDIKSNTSLLQAAYSKLETSRPGIGMLNFFKNTKPDLGNSQQVNQGMLEANARKVKAEFNLVKNDWERKNPGKNFPYEAPDFSSILTKTKIRDSNNQIHEIDTKNIAQAKKIDPGLKVLDE